MTWTYKKLFLFLNMEEYQIMADKKYLDGGGLNPPLG